MRKGLQLGLGFTVLLAAWAQWWPVPQPVLVNAAFRPQAIPSAPSQSAVVREGHSKLPRSASLQSWALEPAKRDPFVPVAVPQRAAARPSEPVAPPPPLAVFNPPPPQPEAPPTTALRYLGVFFNPGGERFLLLADGEAVVTATVGTLLPNGFVVQSVAQDSVRIAHAPTGTARDVPLPVVAGRQP